MSGKRGAESYLTKDDVSSPRMGGGPDESVDPVQRATAAQLANRKYVLFLLLVDAMRVGQNK
jgi:hypothetical protein